MPHNYYNPQVTIRPDQLEAKTGTAKEVWYDRIWETLAERDLMFVIACGEWGEGATTTSSLFHLPVEFPDDDLTAEPFTKGEGDCNHCRHHSSVSVWKFKPVTCFPVGYRDMCSYCMAEFVDWWKKQEREAY